jgi:hypothetical protein
MKEDTKISIQYGRGTISPSVKMLSKVSMPELPPREVVTIKSSRGITHINPHPIRHRRGGAIGIGLMLSFLSGIANTGLPQQTTVLSIKTHQRSKIAFLLGLREEQSVFPYDRRAIATFRKLD